MQYCVKFKEYQQRIFATLGNIESTAGPSEESQRTNAADMEIDATETETQGEPRGILFQEDLVSEKNDMALLTIIIPPVRDLHGTTTLS